MIQYAIIEFKSDKHELEIVETSTLRSFDSSAIPPFECICDWKAKGSKKMKSYDVDVLRLADTRQAAESVLAHLLAGNDVGSWIEGECSKTNLGKGCRELVKKAFDSDSEESIEKMGKSKSVKKKPSQALEIIQRIRARQNAEGVNALTECSASLEEELTELKKENTNLRAALAAVQMLPNMVSSLDSLMKRLPQALECGSNPLNPATSPAFTTPRSHATSARQPSGSITQPPHTSPVTPLFLSPIDRVNVGMNNLDAYEDKEWFATFQSAASRSMSRAGVKVSASQLVNDILHGMYDKAYLANHTVAGGNSSKEVMNAEVVKAISDIVRQRFPETLDTEIKQAIRQKCSNAVKSLKIQELQAAKTTPLNSDK